ncbi:MAG TPA: cytochrome c [Sphingomicrobium sp.]|nr:cytochrome c [Sphingomicrobium sp.]
MRIAMFAAAGAFVFLAGCGGPQTSQANNSHANISNESRATSNGMVMLAAGPVSGQQAVAIMHERHEGMGTIGKTNKAIKRELDSASPNMTTLRAGAAQIADLSRKASGWFPPGTGPDVGKTGAKPDIWRDPQDFASKLHNFQAAAATFNQAAMSGDVNLIKAKWGELGQACKACHDKYRTEMHH